MQHEGEKMATAGLLVIGIAGGTGSGKTTIAKHLYERLKDSNKSVAMITMDSYYRDLAEKPMEERAKTNFDHPHSLETDLLVRHIQKLRSSEVVDVPIYDFEKHQRTTRVTRIEPPDVLILEGILLFVDPKLRDMIDIKVYVDADSDVRFVRRLRRDVAERGRTVEQVCKQYAETVRVMHEEFVEPSKTFADVIVPNLVHGDYDVIVELLAARAMTANGVESPRSKRLRPSS
jgi:uridine kinase